MADASVQRRIYVRLPKALIERLAERAAARRCRLSRVVDEAIDGLLDAILAGAVRDLPVPISTADRVGRYYLPREATSERLRATCAAHKLRLQDVVVTALTRALATPQRRRRS